MRVSGFAVQAVHEVISDYSDVKVEEGHCVTEREAGLDV